ncbi:MAG TPA: hypothetical protein VGV35_18425 [Bryobacteraceae bacterium]|nr:hypothetical protein [Bryobacteraceae bacterium]
MAIDAQKLRTSGVYEVRAPFATLLQDLDQIGDMVQAAEDKRHKLRRYAGIAMIAGLVSAVAAGILNTNALGFCAFLAFTAGVGLFIYSFVTGRDLHKHHDRYELLKELSKTMQVDADPKAKFAVKLALKSQPSLLREEPFPQRKNGKQKFYEEDFITIAGELLDGTYLEETVTELRRERSFTNPRGKSKTKTRSRYLLAVRLGYPNDVYGDARPAQQALKEQIRVPSSATIKNVAVSEKTIAVKAMVRVEKEIPQASAMMCLGAYRILNLARRVAGGAQGGTT